MLPGHMVITTIVQHMSWGRLWPPLAVDRIEGVPTPRFPAILVSYIYWPFSPGPGGSCLAPFPIGVGYMCPCGLSLALYLMWKPP